jgi:hypothetical protein
MGGEGMFTAEIVGRLGLLSLFWLVGLVAACEVFRFLAVARRRQALVLRSLSAGRVETRESVGFCVLRP